MVVIVMGVTGAGKTTIGGALATSLGWEFHDGDDLHSEASKRKMNRGAAFDDSDRAPWLNALRKLIQAMLAEGRNGVVACSALKPELGESRLSKGLETGNRRTGLQPRESFHESGASPKSVRQAGGASRCKHRRCLDGCRRYRECDHDRARTEGDLLPPPCAVWSASSGGCELAGGSTCGTSSTLPV
jgi:hypothetical protein